MTDIKLGKGSLTVSAALGDAVSQTVPLPVELIGLHSQGYARALIGDEMSVTEGEYFVQFTLPDGQRVVADNPVQVVAGKHSEFKFDLASTLGLVAQTLAANTMADSQPTVDAPTQALAVPVSGAESVGRRFAAGASRKERSVAVEGSMRLWRGNLLDVWTKASSLIASSEDASSSADSPRPTAVTDLMDRLLRETEATPSEGRLPIQRGAQPTTALILVRDGRASAFVVPFDERYGAPLQTIVSWRSSGQPSLDYDLGNAKTNTFLSFVRRGERAVARDLSLRGVRDEAGRLAEGKTESPLGAVLGVYVLLRINELEGSDECTANLCSFFPWLPDALAIRVEYLARCGEHQRAVEVLRNADMRGGPWFRSGMNYLLDRLGLYLEIEDDERTEIGLT